MILITGCTHELTFSSSKPQSVEHIRKLFFPFFLEFKLYLFKAFGLCEFLFPATLCNYTYAYFTDLRLAVISRTAAGNILLVNIIVTANCNLDLPTLQTLAAATNIFNFPATPGVRRCGRKIQGAAAGGRGGVCVCVQSSGAAPRAFQTETRWCGQDDDGAGNVAHSYRWWGNCFENHRESAIRLEIRAVGAKRFLDSGT